MPDTGLTWQSEAQPVLESYLCKVGIASADIRSRWVAHVLSGLEIHVGKFAAADMVEQAVERLRDAIDARLARIANLDPQHERREIAGILVVLQEAQHADLVNRLFEDYDGAVDPSLRAQLQTAITPSLPRPVREDARLDMPMQMIELRSINPLRRLFRGFR